MNDELDTPCVVIGAGYNYYSAGQAVANDNGYGPRGTRTIKDLLDALNAEVENGAPLDTPVVIRSYGGGAVWESVSEVSVRWPDEEG